MSPEDFERVMDPDPDERERVAAKMRDTLPKSSRWQLTYYDRGKVIVHTHSPAYGYRRTEHTSTLGARLRLLRHKLGA